jgi:hypothetical protein
MTAPARASEGRSAPDQHAGAGVDGAQVRRAVRALLFLAAVALPCLVLYHAATPGDLLVQAGGAISPWRLIAPDAPDLVIKHACCSSSIFLSRKSRNFV